jgi:hypothetical protein
VLLLLLLLQIGQVCCTTTSPLQFKPRIICNRQPSRLVDSGHKHCISVFASLQQQDVCNLSLATLLLAHAQDSTTS